MAGITQNQSNQTPKQVADRILHLGQLTRQEYLQLITTFLSDYKVTDEERSQINRILDDIQLERVKIVD